MTPEIEEFARNLIAHMRDDSIRSNDATLLASAKGAAARRWRDAARGAFNDSLARAIIPDVVDETIFYLLHAIDQGDIRLLYKASNGNVVDLSIDGGGELAGWFMGSDGWRKTYSKERFVDDFADLKGKIDWGKQP